MRGSRIGQRSRSIALPLSRPFGAPSPPLSGEGLSFAEFRGEGAKQIPIHFFGSFAAEKIPFTERVCPQGARTQYKNNKKETRLCRVSFFNYQDAFFTPGISPL